MDISRQLECGTRYFDIRLELKSNRLKLVHSVIDCRRTAAPGKLYFDEVLDCVTSFLQANPTETVLLCVNRDDGPSAQETFDAFYRTYIKPKPGLWFTANRIPLLKEAAGKIVLLRRADIYGDKQYNPSCAGLDMSSAFDHPQQAGKAPCSYAVKSSSDGFYTAVQDSFNVPPHVKWNDCVLPALTGARADSNTLLINFLSANNGFNSPKKTARYVNTRFAAYPLNKGEHYGITVFDYINAALAKKIIECN